MLILSCGKGRYTSIEQDSRPALPRHLSLLRYTPKLAILEGDGTMRTLLSGQ
jgi:hypothetical protein